MCWSCDNPGGDYLRQVVLPIIERAGWMVQYVEPDGVRAPLAYTVGLTERGLPELVSTGLSPERSAQLLNAVADSGQPLTAGQHVAVGLHAMEVVRLAEPAVHLVTAAQLYGDRLSALQLVRPDERGRWPWHKAYRDGRGGQPVLGPRARPAAP